jgi:outer membrane protein OmpA-like peptidoglycan-associated protein
MRRLKLSGLIAMAVIITMLSSCAELRKLLTESDPKTQTAAFDAAISSLANTLLNQVKKDQESSVVGTLMNQIKKDEKPPQAVRIMLIPFKDASSGEIPEVSRTIEKIIIREGARNFKDFLLTRLNSKNLGTADYILDGTIRPESRDGKDSHYVVSAIVRNLKKIRIIGNADVRISEQNLDYRPAGIYRDSPLYIKNEELKNLMNLENRKTDLTYFDSLEIKAILIEAETAYEEKDYETALKLFNMADDRDDGQILRTYIGLYLTNQKLNRWDDAETALGKIISVSVETHGILSIKFLFEVNSVEFWEADNSNARYAPWLRQIGNYFREHPHCLDIVGHCSRTGPETWNNNLSLERAKAVQKRLEKDFPEVTEYSRAIGKGFKENISGLGTDDERDAIDRRVELIIRECD